jgi:hypothetical protein
MIDVRVYLVGPWVSDGQLRADLREAVGRLGGELCDRLEDGATSIVRVRLVGVERWIEIDRVLAVALLGKPSLRAFELVVQHDLDEVRAWLYRVRLDPRARHQLQRSEEEELTLPGGMDDEDRVDVSGDLALKRIALVEPSAGSTATQHLFVRAPEPPRDDEPTAG